MSGTELTYMCLPNFSFRPNEDIQLGTVLIPSKKTKLPLAEYPLLDATTRIKPEPNNIKLEVEEPKDSQWNYTGHISMGKSTGLWANLPALSFILGGLDVRDSKAHALALQCQRVETQSFKPTNEYISQVLRTSEVRDYRKQHFFPSMYLVVGVKVAYDLSIIHESRSSRAIGGGVQLDMTAFGIPLQVGPKGGVSKDRAGRVSTEKSEPVILAYWLKRIKMKRGDAYTVKNYTRHAFLYDNRQEAFDDTEPSTLEMIWDVEDVRSDMALDD